MKFRLSTLAFSAFLLLPSLVTAADSVRAMANPDASCRQNPLDRFDHGWRIAQEAPTSAGRCLDTTRIRAVTLQSGVKDGFEISNFLHNGKFWNARFERGDVASASVMSVRFGEDIRYVRLAHVQTRFNFVHGIRLQDPVSGDLGPLLKSAIASWESVFPVGEGFDLVKTLRRNVPVVGRVISLEQSLRENPRLSAEVPRVREVALNLNREQANRLFENHVQLSALRGFSLAYLLLLRNCATNLFDILDVTVPTDVRRFRTPLAYDPIEWSTLAALKARGYVALDATWVDTHLTER
jgi:hypothetical protein